MARGGRDPREADDFGWIGAGGTLEVVLGFGGETEDMVWAAGGGAVFGGLTGASGAACTSLAGIATSMSRSNNGSKKNTLMRTFGGELVMGTPALYDPAAVTCT